jgi:hypothetical protein
MKIVLTILISTLLLISCLSDPGTQNQSASPHWVLVWADEFDTPGLPDAAKWSFEAGGFGYNEEDQYYTSPDMHNAWVEEGHLVIQARKEDYEGWKYTSAKLVTGVKTMFIKDNLHVRIPNRGVFIWCSRSLL